MSEETHDITHGTDGMSLLWVLRHFTKETQNVSKETQNVSEKIRRMSEETHDIAHGTDGTSFVVGNVPQSCSP